MSSKMARFKQSTFYYFIISYAIILLQLDGNLPKESGKYLKVILGNINVSILDKAAKYDYKDEYERFKLIVNLVGMSIS